MFMRNGLLFKFLILVVILSTMTCFTSCFNPESVDDPLAQNPEYMIYNGKADGFRASFEYPQIWQRTTVDHYGKAGRMFYILSPDIYVVIAAWSNGDRRTNYTTASEVNQEYINVTDLDISKRTVLSRDKITLGQVEGEKLLVSGIFIQQDHNAPVVQVKYDTPVYVIRIVAIHNNTFYLIHTIVAIDKYESVNEGLEYIISTFQFLD
jgi:hypothetical protein